VFGYILRRDFRRNLYLWREWLFEEKSNVTVTDIKLETRKPTYTDFNFFFNNCHYYLTKIRKFIEKGMPNGEMPIVTTF
jgi:hypothetical protein